MKKTNKNNDNDNALYSKNSLPKIAFLNLDGFDD